MAPSLTLPYLTTPLLPYLSGTILLTHTPRLYKVEKGSLVLGVGAIKHTSDLL